MHKSISVGIVILSLIVLMLSFFTSLVINEAEADVRSMDSDFDGIENTQEGYYGTDAMDADTDDDGVEDGDEKSWNKDSDGDGKINAKDPDSDNDGLTDGTEMGIEDPVPEGGGSIKGTNTQATFPGSTRKTFTADKDPDTTTLMTDDDSDGDGLLDGWFDENENCKCDTDELGEDTNYNGRLDSGEADPNKIDTDGGGVGDKEEITAGNNPQDRDDDKGILDDDGDGVVNKDDAFPNDKTQTEDKDGDGYGDNPMGNNADAFKDNPTQWADSDYDGFGDNPAGTNPDAFPNDPTQHEDYDKDGFGDNQNGLNPDAFPKDSAASKDSDGDGYPDAWNDGKTQADSTTPLTLDAYPDDSTRFKSVSVGGQDSSKDALYIMIAIAVVAVVLVFIIIFAFITITNKQKEEEKAEKAARTQYQTQAASAYAYQQQAVAQQLSAQYRQMGYPAPVQLQAAPGYQPPMTQPGYCRNCGQPMMYHDYSRMYFCNYCQQYQM